MCQDFTKNLGERSIRIIWSFFFLCPLNKSKKTMQKRAMSADWTCKEYLTAILDWVKDDMILVTCINFAVLPLNHSRPRPRQHYDREIYKGRFHSENTSTIFGRHYVGSVKNTQHSPLILDFCLRKTHLGKFIVTSSFSKKLSFQNVFRQLENEGLKIIYEKLRFRDGLL